MNFSRRLLDAYGVAEKLNYSKRTFDKKREQLEQDGFPLPVLAADRYGTNRWDEAAIDDWLDGRRAPGVTISVSAAREDLDRPNKLKQRAEALQI